MGSISKSVTAPVISDDSGDIVRSVLNESCSSPELGTTDVSMTRGVGSTNRNALDVVIPLSCVNV